jgi:hypothetical protein
VEVEHQSSARRGGVVTGHERAATPTARTGIGSREMFLSGAVESGLEIRTRRFRDRPRRPGRCGRAVRCCRPRLPLEPLSTRHVTVFFSLLPFPSVCSRGFLPYNTLVSYTFTPNKGCMSIAN